MRFKFSTTKLNLRRRIWVAVSLVSIIPAIVILNQLFGYYISSLAVLILVFLVVLGWWMIVDISNSIHKINSRSQETLEKMGQSAPCDPYEVQNLDHVISLLSDRVKNGFQELKSFGDKTERLNREVSKKVLVLSTILQANDLYSKGAPAEEVVQFLAFHLKNLLAARVVFCALQSQISDELKIISSLGVSYQEVENFISSERKNIFRLREMVILDKENKSLEWLNLSQKLGIQNLILLPVTSKNTVIGVVGIGNNRGDFIFPKEDKEILSLFSQNVTLIWEYQRVSSRLEKLEAFDGLTGLYNLRMIKKKLNEEIKRGQIYQRPCGLVAVKIKNYQTFQNEKGVIAAENVVKKAAQALKENIRAIDAGGRIAPDILAVVLLEKNKRQSRQVCHTLQEKLEESCGSQLEMDFCVAESPVDGVTAEEIISFIKSELG